MVTISLETLTSLFLLMEALSGTLLQVASSTTNNQL